MKTVTYMGQEFEAPDWATYIAADQDGSVYVYDRHPDWVGNYYTPADHAWDKVVEVGQIINIQPPVERIP